MRVVNYQLAIVELCITVILFSCTQKQNTVVVEGELFPSGLEGVGLSKLSDYGFFKEPLKKLNPTDSVSPYNLNSALFSDYAYKKRFLKIPKGKFASYNSTEVFDFPVGTVLIKNFYYPADFLNPDHDWKIIETRLLINEQGEWKPLTYIWNNEQTDAYLDIAGKSIDVSWKHTDNLVKNIKYSIPNQNQCKSCHMKDGMVMPIGPSARQLNRTIEGGRENQLKFFQDNNKLQGLPELSAIPKLADYNDESESIEARARGWLEVNCGHCHRPEGPAKTSGLYLMASIENPMKLGVGKAPVAAGKGSGGLLYDLVPGQPDKSILYFRITSCDPAIMMPELGRSIAHQEGVGLIRQWITEMK